MIDRTRYNLPSYNHTLTQQSISAPTAKISYETTSGLWDFQKIWPTFLTSKVLCTAKQTHLLGFSIFPKLDLLEADGRPWHTPNLSANLQGLKVSHSCCVSVSETN